MAENGKTGFNWVAAIPWLLGLIFTASLTLSGWAKIETAENEHRISRVEQAQVAEEARRNEQWNSMQKDIAEIKHGIEDLQDYHRQPKGGK